MSYRFPSLILLLALSWNATVDAAETDIRAGERLSDWILRQDAPNYLPGLNWQVPARQEEQAKLKHTLLELLAVHEKASIQSRQRLAQIITALPVTGRVIVPISDPRWLQAHPEQDPILEQEHKVLLPPRPTHVSVIAEDGRQCFLLHRAGLEARDYLSACQPDVTNHVDYAWLIQPDGTVRRFGIAEWNEQTQDEPAPGARIWGPSRDSGWSFYFSRLLTEFLATQPIEPVTVAAHPVDSPKRRPSQDGEISASDWGIIGLLQTPTARMSPAGEARFHFSRVLPYERGNIILQPLDWLEAGFRYTNITNRLYGPDIAGSQTFKDKSFDVKVKLTKEQAYLPQIAIGINDVAGTGLFSSEYLVASKRTGNLDWSLGIGWGYLAGSGNIKNPLSLLNKGFDTRAARDSSGQGGTASLQSFFRGPASLFGGVQYQIPSHRLLLKAEYDGNDYQQEPSNNKQKHSSPFNFGLVYRYHPSLDFTAGIERGNTFMVGITLRSALDQVFTPKLSEPPKVPVLPTRPTAEPDWVRTVSDIVEHSHWSVHQISENPGEIRVVLEDPYGAYWDERINRIAAILHRDAPAKINRFVLVFVEHGIPMTERVILRDAWVKRQIALQAMQDRSDYMAATEPRSDLSRGRSLWKRESRILTTGLVPHYQQTLGGPDGFLLYQAGIAAPMKMKVSESVTITGRLNLGLFDNYEKFKYDGPSNLPRVRTQLREYLTTSALTLSNLQVTHVGRLSNNQFYSLYGGYLEPMFAGVGGEWLYRPWHSHVALGVDINHVRQRSVKQDFSLRDYRVTTGHATLYWDTGWKSTHINLSVGRYLAGDIGMTLDVSRMFANGVTMGAWATKTNVSAEKFGEGSFDKGIYVNIPFDVLMTTHSPAVASLVWQPLTRDGGAKLGRSYTLYGLTNSRDKQQTSFLPAGSHAPYRFDDDDSLWVTEQRLFTDIGKTVTTFGRQLAYGQTGNALLLGGGMILAAALLDRPLSTWANNHQSPRWNTLGKATSAIPFILAAGVGALWLGVGDDIAAKTAWTSIKSGALTLGVETLMKQAVGRARPEQNLGAAHFSPFGKGAADSSFPSIQLGVAHALVTPFAEKYDAPWLHAVAGATAFGRIQQRKHFASDVVAGGLIGYGIGSLLSEQQRLSVPYIRLGPDRSVQAMWTFE